MKTGRQTGRQVVVQQNRLYRLMQVERQTCRQIVMVERQQCR